MEHRFRLGWELESPWLRVEVAQELSLWHQTVNPAVVEGLDAPPTNAWDLSQVLFEGDSTRLTGRLDRLNFALQRRGARIRIGRQAVSMGTGHMFNAISQVPRRQFNVIDPEYPHSEDGVLATFDGALVVDVGFFPKTGPQTSDNYFIRAKSSKRGFDVAFTGGWSDQKAFVGVETAGGLGEELIRGELVVYQRGDQTRFQGLLGLDTVLTSRLSVEFELFYNQFGSGGDYVLMPELAHRPTPYLGRWYTGALFRWDGGARWNASALGIMNMLDNSLRLQLQCTYSLGASTDLLAGHTMGAGGEGSEFGGAIATPQGISLGLPNMTYAALRYYF